MAVTWTSGYNISEAYPFVEWRMKGDENPKRKPAGTLTYTRRQLCGIDQHSLVLNFDNTIIQIVWKKIVCKIKACRALYIQSLDV
jgi:hypothetical protein